MILAASMHDMKNSLCMLLQSIETISDSVNQTEQAKAEFAKVHYEIARVNSNLLQLLAMYRENNESLPLNIEYIYVDELLDELLSKNELYIRNKKIHVSVEVETDLAWYLDNDLIINLLNDILINALKYTTSAIKIQAQEINQKLVITIMDDGPGYPEQMIEKSLTQMSEAILTQGRTGLGLYFANLIAKAHHNKGDDGHISLQNGGKLTGSVFTLTLP